MLTTLVYSEKYLEHKPSEWHPERPEGDLELPEFYDRVDTLDQVVEVDYYVPGCPPQSDKVWEVLDHLIQGKPLPEKGAVLGAGTKTCCDECPRDRKEKKIKKEEHW